MSPLQEAQERHVSNLELRTPQWRQIVRHAFSAGAVAAMTLLPAPKRQKYRGVSAFLRRLAFEGGSIVCTNALTAEQIREARDQGRMLVLADGVGFVIQPRGVPACAPALPDESAVFDEMKRLEPSWNAYGRSRESAVRLALRAVANLQRTPGGVATVVPTEQKGGA